MAKRFTDTAKWTNNKWFFNLSVELKLFWIYLLDNCDSVGVWEENIDLSNIIIGYIYPLDTLLKEFKKQIYVFKDKRKWWIIDFCNFQYGDFHEDSTSKPIQSYISLLKKHGLWKEYLKGMDTLKEKEKDKVKVIDKEKDKEKESLHSIMKSIFLEHYNKSSTVEYYWEGKDGKALNFLITKLKSKCEKEDQIPDAFRVMLEKNTDTWINERLSMTLINSKFNEIIRKIKGSVDPRIEEIKMKHNEEIKREYGIS